MRILLLLGLCGAAWSQYLSSQYDSPLPPRPVIPGAVALGGRGGGRVRGQPQRARPTLDEEDFVPRSRTRLPQPPRAARIRPQISLPPPPPPVVVQPKPVVEPIDESDFDDDPLISFQPSIAPTLPPLLSRPPPPPPQPLRPQPSPKPIENYPTPTRPQFRNTIQEEDLDIPTRQLPLEPSRGRPQYRPTSPAPPSAPSRGSQQSYNRQQQLSKPSKKDSLKNTEEVNVPRNRKTVQVIRKYREDNPDGSITWGFENDDGTYKEETIGVDCVTRGKYGYYDPDGVRREFTYSSGIPCEKRDEEEDAEQQGSDHGYVDYSNNRYVMANGDSIDLDHMVKNRARKPVQSYYRN